MRGAPTSAVKRWPVAVLTGWLQWCSSGEAVARAHHHPLGCTELEGGRRCCSSQRGEVRPDIRTAEWEMWCLVVVVSSSSKLTLNISWFQKC